jgi:PHD/YefM family antitoxin component YafN of YafNO toxin-antitoxin module
MRKPDELIELLETLRESGHDKTVTTGHNAHAIVYIGKTQLELPARDCMLLLSTEETVENLFEAIGSPTDASIELHDLEVEDAVKTALEGLFSTVDET